MTFVASDYTYKTFFSTLYSSSRSATKMDFDLEDGLHFAKSLTGKVMSIFGKLQVSHDKTTDHVTKKSCVTYPVNIDPFPDDTSLDDCESLAETSRGSPRYLGRWSETNDDKYKLHRRRMSIKEESLGVSKNRIKADKRLNSTKSSKDNQREFIESDQSVSNMVFEPTTDSCNSRYRFNASDDLLGLSSSVSMHMLDKTHAELWDRALGLSESLRNIYLNCSKNMDSTRRVLTQKDSQTHKMSIHPELFRTGSDCESTDSIHDSDFSSCYTNTSNDKNGFSYSSRFGIFQPDSSECGLSREASSSSCSRMQTTGGSEVGAFSSDRSTDLELVKIRYDTDDTSCCTSNDRSEQFDSRNESEIDNSGSGSSLGGNPKVSSTNIKSFTEEFKHDIDFLARSAYRTSTPEKAEFGVCSVKFDENSPVGKAVASPKQSVTKQKHIISMTESSAFSNLCNVDIPSLNSMADCETYSRHTLADLIAINTSKRFVHGLSPLCNEHMSSNGNQSCSRLRVRRSLIFVSPPKSIVMLHKKDLENSLAASPRYQTNQSCFRNSANSKTASSKSVFRDETEEAVFYLITKYLENSQCQW